MKILFKSFLPVVLCLAGAQAAIAQSVVGRSALDGRSIEIMSDQTWRYTQDQAAKSDCREIASRIEFCGAPSQWAPQPAPTAAVAAQFRFDARHYAQYVIEDLGADDGLTAEFMRKAVIVNAARATGMKETDIAVLDVFASSVAGHEAETIVYQLAVNSLDIVYVNTVVILPKRTVQVMTFAVGTTYTDKHRDIDAQFVSLTKVN